MRHGANLTHPSRDAFTAREHLRALLALGDGSLGIVLTGAEQQRVAQAAREKVGHWRYHLSLTGLGAYWRGPHLRRRPSDRWAFLRHLLADPRSLLRTVFGEDGSTLRPPPANGKGV